MRGPAGPPIPLRVRPVTAADRDEWLRMRAALWPETDAETHRREIAALFSEGADGGPPVLVAELPAGRLVGLAELSIRGYAEGCSSAAVAYLEGWWVDPDQRRHGIGRALVDAAIEWARAHGSSELASDTELDNRLSQAAHAALGFAEVGRVVCYRLTIPTRPSSS